MANIDNLHTGLIMTKVKATKIATGLNAEVERGETTIYAVEPKGHGYVIAIYEDGDFILNL